MRGAECGVRSAECMVPWECRQQTEDAGGVSLPALTFALPLPHLAQLGGAKRVARAARRARGVQVQLLIGARGGVVVEALQGSGGALEREVVEAFLLLLFVVWSCVCECVCENISQSKTRTTGQTPTCK